MYNLKSLKFLSIIIGVFIMFISFCSQAPASIDDNKITTAIENEYLLSTNVSIQNVDVETDNGIVTLKGEVTDLLAEERAIRIAESIKGVRAVIDQIQVKPVKVSDSTIEKNIQKALLWDPATEQYEISAYSDNGKVILKGEVESWSEKQLVEKVVKDVKGIKSINNEIDINYTEDRSDYEIKKEIEKRLIYNPYVNDNLINVKVMDGKVTLEGEIGSSAEKQYAKSSAWVYGVESVNIDDLDVDADVKDEKKGYFKNAKKTDDEIEKAVNDAFLYDPRVNSFNVNVDSEFGVVTLTGLVDNLNAKKAAERDAKNTIGVIKVNNNLLVSSSDLPKDPKVAERIRDAFYWDPVISRYDISVNVDDNKAYLYGVVDSLYERKRAENIAAGISGVVAVQNNLSLLTSWDWKPDDKIEKAINDELFWSWYVNSDDVIVNVENGIAKLTGTVDGWNEVSAAITNAFEGGAMAVKSRLKIKGEHSHYPVYYYEEYEDWPYEDVGYIIY